MAEGRDSNDMHPGKKPKYDDSPKVFNDPIHGTIEVNAVCKAIIDTPEFQRLRFLKQLGLSYYVYPGASHNRFEHCIGTYHLAGKMMRNIKNRQSEGVGKIITDKDILCVEIAALCHDIGHGPYSHTFDGKFIPQVTNVKWTHEKASNDMISHMIKEHGFLDDDGIMSKEGLSWADIDFIKELINPTGNESEEDPERKEKAFLYEIVSNKRTGIDVDKWDYFARDCHHLGIVNNFDHNRFIEFIRVVKVNGRNIICCRDKEIGNLYQMFSTRYNLHRTAYQHRVTCAAEFMVVDALLIANDIIKIPYRDSENRYKEIKMSECIYEMAAYTNLNDNILWLIQTSKNPEIEKAKQIIDRLHKRDLYQCLDEKRVPENLLLSISTNIKEAQETLQKEMAEILERERSSKQFHLQIVSMDFGNKNNDPLKAMFCYTKKDMDKAEPSDGSKAGLLMPKRFSDTLLRVYSTCSRADPNAATIDEKIKCCFNRVCQNHGIDGSTTKDVETQT